MDKQGEESRVSRSRSILEVIALTILAFAAATAVGVVFIVQMVALGYAVQTTFVLVGSTAVGQLAMFALGYGYFRRRDVRIPLDRPSLRDGEYILGGVLLALVAATGISMVLAALKLLPSSVIGETATTNPTYLLGLAVLSVVLVAPVEEFVFRGVIQGQLRRQFGRLPAIAGASLLFGSMHLANYSGKPIPVIAGALMIAVVGAVFGSLYERTDNLAVPIVVHAAYNVVLLLISFVAARTL